MSFFEKLEMFQLAALIPALTLFILTRRRVGLNLTKSMMIGLTAIALFGVGYTAHSRGLKAFAVAIFRAAKWQTYWRWVEFKRGQAWHGYCQGISIIELLPVRRFKLLVEDARIYRFADPFLYLVIGAIILPVDKWLGLWVIFAALSSRVFAEYSFQKAIDKLLMQLNGMLDSEALHNFMMRFASGERIPLMQGDQATLGLPPSTGDAVQKAIHDFAQSQKVREEQFRRDVSDIVSGMNGETANQETQVVYVDNSTSFHATVVHATK